MINNRRRMMYQNRNMRENAMIYVDNSSTTALEPSVLSKMMPYLTLNYANASGNYKFAKEARKAVEEARVKIAKCINADSEEIIFTSSGTEADNLAILGLARKYKNKGRHIITSKFEHFAVLNACKELEKEGFNVTYVDVGENGIINSQEVKRQIKQDTILVSIMYVNNEIGTIQNIKEISDICKSRGIIFHTDAVQAAPHIKLDAKLCDSMSISGHKFNGPKGVGALYLRKGLTLDPIIFGGHQENSIRPGTENVAGIVGMAEALEYTQYNLDSNNEIELKLRNYLKEQLLKNIDGIIINGDEEQRIAGNLNISIDGIDTSELLVFLDMNNICASVGSACNSNIKDVSHVIKALGKNSSSLRFTLSKYNTYDDMDKIVNVINRGISMIRDKMQ